MGADLADLLRTIFVAIFYMIFYEKYKNIALAYDALFATRHAVLYIFVCVAVAIADMLAMQHDAPLFIFL